MIYFKYSQIDFILEKVLESFPKLYIYNHVSLDKDCINEHILNSCIYIVSMDKHCNDK